MNDKPRILIAGVGGASLGTEILKCLLMAGRYSVYGCDISDLAYGHYQDGFDQTFLVDRKDYIESVLDICKAAAIDVIIPGGEEPLVLLTGANDLLRKRGIGIAANSPALVKNFCNKQSTFKILSEFGFQVPLTVTVNAPADLDAMTYPCVVKPATGSGGSSFVFLAAHRDEALLYVNYLVKNGKQAIVQEYVSEEEGEFTIGVLSLPGGEIAGSLALKRSFDSKLSVLSKSNEGVISSGYSQGLIDDFPALRAAAERIALAIESVGPINIQGRVKNGTLLPFEINPRFSASTYLRALAGFNEVDIFLQYITRNVLMKPAALRSGYYLRTFNEVWVGKDKIIS